MPGVRIIDGYRTARSVPQLAEIPLPHFGLGNTEDQRLWGTLAVPLEVQQKERPVAAVVKFRNIDRTVDFHAVLVQPMTILRSAVTIPIGIDGHASGVILKGIGIPGAAPGELVNGAVKAVPSTLQ